jgi:hypothetical protein
MAFKTVKHLIRVPSGDYCWEHTGDKSICPFFSNDGGHSTCDLGFYIDRKQNDVNGVVKSNECIDLKESSHGT